MDIEFLNDRLSIDDYMQSIGYNKSNSSTSNHSCYHSPFTDEKTPSFKVNLSKNTFSDYSSGERGDIIKLVELTQRCTFKGAVAYLESKAGELPVRMIQEKKELIDSLIRKTKGEDIVRTQMETTGTETEMISGQA
jgi:DNA primase